LDGHDWAFGVEGALFAGEGGRVAADDPDLDVRGLLADDGRDYAGDTAEVDLDLGVDCLSLRTGDGTDVFAEGRDDEFDQAGLG
jgi:hypothetical protein